MSSRVGINEVLSYKIPSSTSSVYSGDDESNSTEADCVDTVNEEKPKESQVAVLEETPHQVPDSSRSHHENPPVAEGGNETEMGEENSKVNNETDMSIIDVIVNMASKCEVLSVRGYVKINNIQMDSFSLPMNFSRQLSLNCYQRVSCVVGPNLSL